MSLDWERVRMFDREVAQMFLNMIKQESCARLDLSVIGGFCSKFIRSFKNDHRCLLYLLHFVRTFRSGNVHRYYCFLFCRVVDVVQKEKSKARPIALNTVELLRAASSGLGNCVCVFVVIFVEIGFSCF